MFPNLLDIGCYSHILDLVGSKFDLPTVEEFIKPWISLFSHSSKAIGLNEKAKQVDQWHLTVKSAGGAGGRFSIRLCSSLETYIHSCKSRLSFLQPQGASCSRSWQTP